MLLQNETNETIFYHPLKIHNLKGKKMVKITIELNGSLISLIEQQAKKDGHTSRCAVIRKAINCFLADGSPNVANIVPDNTGKNIVTALELPDNVIELLDARAQQDGHKNRSAVIRRAVNYFFAH